MARYRTIHGGAGVIVRKVIQGARVGYVHTERGRRIKTGITPDNKRTKIVERRRVQHVNKKDTGDPNMAPNTTPGALSITGGGSSTSDWTAGATGGQANVQILGIEPDTTVPGQTPVASTTTTTGGSKRVREPALQAIRDAFLGIKKART